MFYEYFRQFFHLLHSAIYDSIMIPAGKIVIYFVAKY